MFERIVVPVDGSPRSLDAVSIGSVIAAERGIALEAVTVIDSDAERESEQDRLSVLLDGVGELPVAAAAVVLTGEFVSETIARYVAEVPVATVVMSSTGRGRSAAVLGSVAEDLLRAELGPVFVIGPRATARSSLAADVVVPVDGSPLSESALAAAGAWCADGNARVWVVTVVDVDSDFPRALESSYVARTAGILQRSVPSGVEYEVLHGDSPAHAIVDYAEAVDAGLIVMSTHGRSGFRRIVLGSVAADVIRHAPCPVLVQRPTSTTDAAQSGVSNVGVES